MVGTSDGWNWSVLGRSLDSLAKLDIRLIILNKLKLLSEQIDKRCVLCFDFYLYWMYRNR